MVSEQNPERSSLLSSFDELLLLGWIYYSRPQFFFFFICTKEAVGELLEVSSNFLNIL